MNTKKNYEAMSNTLFHFDAMLNSDPLEMLQVDPIKYKNIGKKTKLELQKLIDIKLYPSSDSYVYFVR